MSIYTKLFEVQKATRSLASDKEGQTGSAKYPYTSGAKVLSVIRPKMDEVGLLLLQEVVSINNERIDYRTNKGEQSGMLTSCQFRFTWVDVETGEKLEQLFAANGMNSWDKGLGSALTYAERYYLLKTFHIATDRDDVDALLRDESIPLNDKSMNVIAGNLAACRTKKEWDELVADINATYAPSQQQWDLISQMIETKRNK